MDDVLNASEILRAMLAADFAGADAYRAQLPFARLSRHETGCSVVVARDRVPAAPFDAGVPGARLPVQATGHGKLWILLHGFEGYLDDLDLLEARRFPDLATVRVHAG